MSTAVQPLLSVGKKANHFFSYREPVEDLQQDRVTLIWGGVPFVSYLEKDQKVIPNTLAVGLVAGGMRQTDVSEVLGINPRQLQRYLRGTTSLEKDPGRPPIVTEEIREFVTAEYLRLCCEGPRRWRKQMGEAVTEKFHVTLKPSTLSALVAEHSGGSSSVEATEAEVGTAAEEIPQEAEEGQAAEQTEIPSGRPEGESEPSEPESQPRLVPLRLPEDPTELPEVLRQPGPIGPEAGDFELERESVEQILRKGIYSRYAGGLLLNPFIARMMEGVLKEERAAQPATQISFQSYLLTFLQMNTFECNNYESVQELHADEFGPLAGLARSPSINTMYRITPEFLSQVEPAQFNQLIAGNYLNNLAVGSRLFYVDGHFQRYFGKKKMLRAFHPQTHHMQKGYTQYALSTQDGSPFFLFDSDSMVSFQQSIGVLVERLVALMPEGIVPRIVFDRGGYDRRLMARFGGEQARGRQFCAHYISWDQFDDTDYSGYELAWEEVVLELKGNDAAHPKHLELKVAQAPREVQLGIWAEKSPVKHHRKLILRQDLVRHGVHRVLCTPFCTSDLETTASDLVAQLCLRWRQENVFKIADGDYGFDYISTYRTKPYSPGIVMDFPPSLQQILAEHMIANPERRKAKAERDRIGAILGRIAGRLESLRRGEKLKKDLSKLKLPDDEDALNRLYEEYLAEYRRIDAERLQKPGKVNRLEYLGENGYSRLDFSKKWVLDILRAAAHNIRRMGLNTWMGVYWDWRDYTQRFRDLLTVGGYLHLKGKVLHVELKSMQQPRYQQAAQAFVHKIQRLSPVTFGIGPYAIRFSFKDTTNL